jgi:hypothetical protein
MALCEFGCPSLDYVYDMSWAEFRIRQFAYNRQEKNNLFKLRELAYVSYISPHIELKSIPSKEKFMPLEGNKGVTDKMIERMREAVNKFKEENNANTRITSKNRGGNNRPRKEPSQSTKKSREV